MARSAVRQTDVGDGSSDFQSAARPRELPMKFRLACRIVFLVGLFSATLLRAQDSASVTGTVRDSSGASVANAQVTVSATDRGITRETSTNSDGEYSVPALPPGAYNVSVTAK